VNIVLGMNKVTYNRLSAFFLDLREWVMQFSLMLQTRVSDWDYERPKEGDKQDSDSVLLKIHMYNRLHDK
jgi:hypothetical protein